MKSSSRQLRRAAATWTIVAGVLAGLSCNDSTTPPIAAVGKPAAMLIVSGDVQQGTVGTELPAAVVVRVVDSAGKSVKGQIVNFRVVAGGGSVFAGTGLTNDAGEARERWTLGTVAADSQRLEARAVDAASGAALVFATFRATAVAGAASKLKKASADSTQATVASAVTTPPSVKVVDQFDNPVAGTAVTFAVASGGGSLTGGSQATSSTGIATVGGWTVGNTAGTNTLSATATGLSGSPISFTAIGSAGAAAQLVLATSAVGAAGGAAFTTQPVVAIRDAAGNTRTSDNSTVVTMTVSAGATVVGAATATVASGVAAFTNVGISGTAGTSYTLTFAATGLTSATQSITPAVGAAGAIAVNGGNNQTAASGTAVPTPPSVKVTDAGGNAVNGAVVTFAVDTGDGSITGASQVTNASGIATIGSWTLYRAGTNRLRASVAGLAGSPAMFTATATSSVASVSVAPISFGILVGDTVTLSATALDGSGRVVTGMVTNWEPVSPAGSISASGLLTGLAVGGGPLKATIGGVTGPPGGGGFSVYSSLDSVAFNGWSGTTLTSGGTTVCVQLGTWGSPGSTEALRWTAAVSDSSMIAIDAVTPARSQHCFGGVKAGNVTAYGSFGGKTAQKSVTVVAGAATQLLLTTSAAGAASGAPFATQPVVAIRDAAGNTRTSDNNTVVTMTVSGGATVVGTATATAAGGVATFLDVGVSGSAATYTLTFAAGSANTTQSISLTSFSKIAAGGYHTCALTQAGQAYCWGENVSGQLGNGFASGLTATPVSGGLTFSAVAMAESHTCALSSTGAAYCWGDNGLGELGDGTTTIRGTPTAVSGILTFAALTAGNLFTCAATSAGAGYCWGTDGSGQLGDGTTTVGSAPHATPQPMSGSQQFASLVAGDGHACGLTASGTAYCWGRNGAGQLGDATNSMRSAPVATGGGLTFTGLAAGNDHTCGITGAGAAYCWGRNDYGQLGDGTTVNRNIPVPVIGGIVFTSIVAGAFYNCALTSIGTMYCWGVNPHSQFGNGAISFQAATPVLVSTPLRFASLAAGYDHTCGLTSAGAAYCWGRNDYGQVGDGTTIERGTAVLVRRP